MKKRFNWQDGKGTVHRHPRHNQQAGPDGLHGRSINNLWSAISYLEERLERSERRFARQINELRIKNKLLSRRHQHTRQLATKCRNHLFPIPAEEIESIRNEINERREIRKRNLIREKLEKEARERRIAEMRVKHAIPKEQKEPQVA